MKSFEEFPVYLPRGVEHLASVVCVPTGDARDLGVVLLGGAITRMNRHGIAVREARALAEHGIPSIRFDYRGVGDSTGRGRFDPDVPFDVDARAAAAFLQEATGARRLAFLTTCFGGAVGMAAAAQHPDAVAVISFFPGSGILIPRVRKPLRTRTRVKYLIRRAPLGRSLLQRPSVQRMRDKVSAEKPEVVISTRFTRDLQTFLRRGTVRFVFGEHGTRLPEFRKWLAEIEAGLSPEQRARMRLDTIAGAKFSWAESLEEQQLMLDRAIGSVLETLGDRHDTASEGGNGAVVALEPGPGREPSRGSRG